jgi:hypothetical protein
MPKPMPIGIAREDKCAVCGRRPRTLRATMRCAVNALPLKETVCDKCAVAFWANITAKAQRERPG